LFARAPSLSLSSTLAFLREPSQTKVVVLISLLALARKFIILDLGVTYWLMREREPPPLTASFRDL
jgi:hypothetical protein